MQSIVVLGMHRSGTSALARSVADLGAWVGSETHITRRGEHELIQDCNQEILTRMGGHWSAPPVLQEGWHRDARLATLDAAAVSALDDFEGHDVIAWKDPRNCFTLAYWRERFTTPPVTLLIVRHPLEVAASLAQRNGFGIGHAVALWEAYNRAALASMHGLRACVVQYSELVSRPAATVQRVVDDLAHLGVEFAGTAAHGAERIDPQRRHHVADGEALESAVTHQQGVLWSLLTQLETTYSDFGVQSGVSHAASVELLAERARAIRLERDLSAAQSLLRSRRDAVRRIFKAT